MTGLDVIGIAETGSGKTLAYLLPMYRHILDQKPIQVCFYLIFFFHDNSLFIINGKKILNFLNTL